MQNDDDAAAGKTNPFKDSPKRRKTVNKPSAPLPSDKLAEMSILGTLITEPHLFFESCQELRADDFTFEAHRRIYRAMLALFAENRPMEIVPLVQQLQSTDELATVGGATYLSELVIHDLPSAAHIQCQVERLIEVRKKREVIVVCNDVEALAYDWEMSGQQCIEKLNREAMSLSAEGGDKEAVKFGELISPTVAEWRNRSKANGAHPVGMTFGLPHLDKATTGMWPGELTLLGGHTKDAKTATAIAIIIANLKQGIPVFYASHEMSREQVYARIIAQEANVQFSRLRDTRLMTTRDWAAVDAVNSYIQKWPLTIDDSPTIDVGKLVALGRLFARRDGCKLMVVDYLQRVIGPGERRYEVVSNVSRLLCGLAKQEKIHVLILSQLTNPMDRERKKIMPNLRMFRDSGDPVQDAHIVMAVWRPEEDGRLTGQDQILILAQRNGPGNTFVDVGFDTDRLCYFERTTGKKGPPQKGIDYDDDRHYTA